MRNDRVESPSDIESKPSMGPEIDYTPREYTLREQIVFGAKTVGFIGFIIFVFWLLHLKNG